MGDSDATAAGKTDEQEQPQAGTTKDDQSQADTAADQASGAEEAKPTVDPEIAKLRKEAASYRTKLREYEKAEEARKQAEMTEAEKVAERAKQLEEREKAFSQQQREFAARSAVIEEARKAGFKISPERVFALVKGDIEFTDDGSPTNVPAVVQGLASSEPGLIGAVNGSATNPHRPGGSGLTAAQIAGMSDAELEKAGISVRDMFDIAAKG